MNNTLKKFTAVFTSALMLTSAFSLGTTTAFADEAPVDNYLVAGRPTEIFGTDFDPANHDNDMTTTDNGATYTKTYTVDKAYENVMLKVVKPAESSADVIWYGDENNGNVTFDITEASTFTVTFTPATSEVSVTGSAVQFKNSMNYSYVIAAGNGEGNWLNGQDWVESAAVNTMTEIEDDVWQISFADVPEGFDRQIKFAIDGGWTFNFGKPKDGLAPAFEEGVWFDAFWDGDNISFDVEEISDITATLDLSEFDYATKTGAKYKIDIIPNNYLVAGRPAEIFGTDFDPANHDNDMEWDDTADNDTTYTKSYTVDKAYQNVMLKVVKNETEWFGDENQGNVTFDITGPSTFTVTFDAITHEVTVTGAKVEFKDGMSYSFVNAAGNGENNWLNGQDWVEGAAINTMTEIADDVWQISYHNVTEAFDRQVKFAVDGSWTFNFGKPKDGLAPAFENGVWFDAFWDGDNINFDTEDNCTVILTLDLSNFDYATKTGAKYKVDIIYNEDIVIGDVNNDGSVTIDDATALQRYLAEFDTLDATALANADVNGDGKINIKDVTKIQRVVAELESF